MRGFVLFFWLVFLAGCASGSALVTGQVRPAIEDFNTVEILTEMPEGAEEIAIVDSISGVGLNRQKRLDYAMEELKKQAAKVGANAVVITKRETKSQLVGIPTHSGGTMIGTDEDEIVEGIAIWIE